MDHQKLFAIMSGKDRSAKAHVMRMGFSCAEPFYRVATGVRNKLFDWGIRKAVELPRPVISVGNITTGGTGKTPMVIALTKKLLAMGEKPAVLLRGYGGTIRTTIDVDFESGATEEERRIAMDELAARWAADDAEAGRDYSSDETKVLRRVLPDTVPIVEHESRVEAAEKAIESHPDISIFILDDAFQHRKVTRDLDLVLIDATQPFGFDHVLPRGLLREGMQNLKRSHAIIVTRCDQVTIATLQELDSRIQNITGKGPIAHAAESWSGLRDVEDRTCDLNLIAGQHNFGVCGIGNPKGFVNALNQVSQHVDTLIFKDHNYYEANDLERIYQRAIKAKCDAIVTTEKDWVKWHEFWPWLNASIPVYRPILDIEFTDGEDALDALIRERVLDYRVSSSNE